jgi:Amt family ammonium transporter
VNFVYVGGMTAIALFIIGKLVGNRVSVEDELAGLDVPEMGVLAYPDDAPLHAIAPAAEGESAIGVVGAERAVS